MDKVGRPLKYQSVQQLQEDIDKYFAECEAKDKPYTMSGLALSMGIDRTTLINYSHRDEYFNTIKKAKNKVETYMENKLISSSGNVTGVIFNLKNNFNWVDRQEIDAKVDQTTTINVEITDGEVSS